MKNKNSKNNRGFILPLAVLFGIIAAIIGMIIFYQAGHAPKAPTTAAISAPESSTAPKQNAGKEDAGTYYAENSEKVISVTPAATSVQVYSEQNIGKELAARGFGETAPITYEYSIDGSVKEKTEIDRTSSETHPQYTVIYTTESGDYWTVSVCNNSVTAYPVTYNLEHNGGTELIITESSSITAYDSSTNCFYETVPKSTVLVVKQIPAITAQALEKLTAQEIEKL